MEKLEKLKKILLEDDEVELFKFYLIENQKVDDDECSKLATFLLDISSPNGSISNILGMMHSNGMGVQQDDKKTMKYFQLAAEQGNSSGYFNLGLAYYHGKYGMDINKEKTLYLLSISLKKGNMLAKRKLRSIMLSENILKFYATIYEKNEQLEKELAEKKSELTDALNLIDKKRKVFRKQSF